MSAAKTSALRAPWLGQPRRCARRPQAPEDAAGAGAGAILSSILSRASDNSATEGRSRWPEDGSLLDIENVWAFARATLNAAPVTFDHDEFIELEAEAVLILYQLADKYEAHRIGYESPGRFSGYAAKFLPRRLDDAWHRLHPEHVYATTPEGKREWVYLKQTVSIEDQCASTFAAKAGVRERIAGGPTESRFLPTDHWTPVGPAERIAA